MSSFWLSGMACFTIVVMNVNIKIGLFSYEFSIIIIGSLVGSIALYVLCYYAESRLLIAAMDYNTFIRFHIIF